MVKTKLFEGAIKGCVASKGSSSLHLTSSEGHKVVKASLLVDKKICVTRDKYERTPIHSKKSSDCFIRTCQELQRNELEEKFNPTCMQTLAMDREKFFFEIDVGDEEFFYGNTNYTYAPDCNWIGHMLAVRSQMDMNLSCWAFVAAELISAHLSIESGGNKRLPASIQFFIDYVHLELPSPEVIRSRNYKELVIDIQGYPNTVIRALEFAKRHGVPLVKDFPFLNKCRMIGKGKRFGVDKPPKQKNGEHRICIQNFHVHEGVDVDRYLRTNGRIHTKASRLDFFRYLTRGPVGISLLVAESFLYWPNSRIPNYDPSSDDVYTGPFDHEWEYFKLCQTKPLPLKSHRMHPHAVVVVSCGTAEFVRYPPNRDHPDGHIKTKVPFLLVKNSHGETFGHKGFIRIVADIKVPEYIEYNVDYFWDLTFPTDVSCSDLVI